MSECIYCGKDEDDGVELIESESPNDYFCNECLSNFEALNAINAKLRARVAELENQYKKLYGNYTKKVMRLSELEQQVESMRNCGNCGVNSRKCAGDFDFVPVTIQRDRVDNGMKHWRPRGNDEGGGMR